MTDTATALFSAPVDFAPELRDEYQAVVPITFHQVWDREDLPTESDATAWLPNPGQNFTVDEAVLDRFPNLEVIITPSTGTNHIDLEAAEARRVEVLSLLDDREGLNRIAASGEFTFLLTLNTLRRLDVAAHEVETRRWRRREDLLRGRELQGKRVGLVGMGRIGRRMTRYCQAFGAEVVYHDPYVDADDLKHLPLPDLFGTCEVVCVCCSLTDETRGMVDRSLMERLPEGSALVNTSRGEVLVEEDLAELLDERPDLRVGLDVLAGETHDTHLDSPLLEYHDERRIVVTPHVAGATVESQSKAARIALGLLEDYLEGGGEGS